MTRILVLYYSRYGHVKALAEAVSSGAQEVADTIVDIRRVPDIQLLHDQAASHDASVPTAEVSELPKYDAIILGSPTRFGNMASQMKHFIDQAGGLWASNALVGKVGSVFTSSGSQHGGQEAAILSSQIPLMHLGMVIVGLPYTFSQQTQIEYISGCSPYGATTVAGGDGSRKPTDVDLAGAFYQGRHVAEVASRLSGYRAFEEVTPAA